MSLNTILATAPLTTQNYILKATGTTIGNSLIWDNGTNVGIGNTNTSYTLDVSGTGRFTGNINAAVGVFNASNETVKMYGTNPYISWWDGTSTTRYGYIQGSSGLLNIIAGTSCDMNFSTNGSDRMRITSAGNVGIGITPQAWSSSYKSLQVGGASLLNDIGTNTYLGTNIYLGTDGQWKYSTTQGASIMGLETNSWVFYNAASGSANSNISWSERMRITSGGDVAIGTTSTGGIRLYVQSASNNWTGNFQGNTTSGQSLGLLVTAGTTSADSSFFIQNATGANLYMKVRGDGWFYIPSITNGAGSYALKWQSGGLVTFDTSSARYKDNIRDSNYGLSDIMKLRSAMFEYKSDARTDIGLIAEEIYEVIPELVTLNEDGLPDAVSYDRFVSVLIKSLQEMNTKLDDQNQTIQNLQEQINILAK